MTNVQSAPSESTETLKTEQPDQGRKGLFVVVAIIAVAIIGLGVWALVDSNSGSDVTLPDAAADTLDGYMAAGNDYDGEALIGYVTPSFKFESYGVVEDADAHAATVTNEWERIEFNADRVGDSAVSGSETTYVVAEPEMVSWTGQDGIYGMSVFNLVELDGTWLIDYHEWVPEGLR